MATNMSEVAGTLKRIYDTYLETAQNLKHRSIDEIGKSAKKYNAGGEGFYGAINDYGNESIGAITEGETFRTIDSEHAQQWKVSPKILVAPVQFSGLVSKAADSDEEAFASAVVHALDMAKDRLLSDENRQFFGKGTGLLASPAGAVASNVTSFSVDSVQYLRKNQVVDIYSGSTLTVTGVRIANVDQANKVIYFSSSIGVALNATMEIVKENVRKSAPSDGKEMMGLRGIVDDGTELTTFQNLDASSIFEWRGLRTAAASANLSQDLLQRLIDDVELIRGEAPDLILMHPKQRRKYLDIVMSSKRYTSQKLDAGADLDSLTFNGMKLRLDKDCQTDTVYAINKSALRRFEVAPLEMASHDGSDVFLRLANQDAFQAYWRHYANFGTSARNAHGKLVGLAVPNGIG